MISIYSVSLGCPKNRVDTEWLLGAVPGPVTAVNRPEEADLVLINTCGFIRPAVEESVRTIVQAIDDVDTASKRPLLAVTGCLVGRYGQEGLAAELPEVDLWLTNLDMVRWPVMVAQALGRAPNTNPMRLLSTGPSYAYLKISDGCDHNCAFCTIPSIRGSLASTPAETVERDARHLLAQGVKELVFVAQDVTAYGRETGLKHGLRELLDRILPLEGLARLRLMYLYPAGLTKDFLHYLRDAGSPFVPYFDVPLQHAHPDVLSRMGRPFARNPREVTDRIREVFPHAALRTSFIVGYPGETQEHWEYLRTFIEETRFHHMGVFAYMAEEGTPAADMPDQRPDAEKEWRRDALMEMQAEISEDILSAHEGDRMEILVDAGHEEWPGLHVGRTWFQAPEVDGVTYISGPEVAPGALVEADIVETREYDLVALA
ncbi:30S ribosomal protein S12 methylthiotransferase RimO [Desulfovibrio psychrotolerans]|uniref:Ribosomal protein uS12 methylthiotransferase RimO n=1 Tax=Desulfovibrio psychrotolerans TaxID=415242 RepID=A0A7J0BSP8_9BACT|nr:30S ribosomal protein S12 methylthiotransferase RimO [Desulfovibrio psychrotolerans]GFM36720.1 ribosomal protein S12 methylthiotransferase RimO [Desulfovibrio psychrotolerans]